MKVFSIDGWRLRLMGFTKQESQNIIVIAKDLKISAIGLGEFIKKENIVLIRGYEFQGRDNLD